MQTIWAGWCPVHNGSAPPFDHKGYTCGNCGKTVCALDFYVTSKGGRCGLCLSDIDEGELKTLKAFYDPNAFSDSRKEFNRITLALFVGSFAMLMAYLLFGYPVPGYGAVENVLLTWVALFALLGILAMPYYYLRFRKEEKAETIKPKE